MNNTSFVTFFIVFCFVFAGEKVAIQSAKIVKAFQSELHRQ